MEQDYANRLEWFRQFKRTANVSNNTLVVGIDISKDKHHAFFGGPGGRTVLKRLIFENSIGGFETLLFHADSQLAKEKLEDVVFGVEPTSVYHKPLSEFLITMGYNVVYVTNHAIKKNRTLLDGRWDKNDTKDSANVADLVSRGKCHFYDFPDLNLRDIRSLLLLRKRLKKQEHRFMTRIRNNLVAQYFPELDHAWYSSHKENLSIVRWCLSPEKICQLDFDDFCRMVTSKRLGIRQYKRLRYVWEAARESIGCTIGPAAEFEAQVLTEQLEDTRRRLGEVEETVYTICESYREYELLKTIPGFGPYVSAVVMAAIGAQDRFESGKQVLRLAGLDLNAKRSGKTSKTAVPVISKAGKAELRYALYQAAKVATSLTAEFRAYFKRLIKGREREKGIGTKMRVKVSAKMLVIAWTMMKRMQPYQPGLLVIDEPVQQRRR